MLARVVPHELHLSLSHECMIGIVAHGSELVSQEGTGVEPAGEAKERKTPAHLATYENGKNWRGNISRGLRQIGLGGVF